jgi:DNA-binding XRE family transcriptional regulator
MEQKWTRQYQTILSFNTKERQLTVAFANGDTVTIPCTQLLPPAITKVTWERARLAADGFSVAIPAEPRTLEVSWSVIRNLTDEDFARHMAEVAAEQARYIGKRIRELRERRELTQAKVASLTGIEQPNISRIENGVFDVSTSTLGKILRVMGFSARDLAA